MPRISSHIWSLVRGTMNGALVELGILIGWAFRIAGYLWEVTAHAGSLKCGYDLKADYFLLKVLNKQEWSAVKSETHRKSARLQVKWSRPQDETEYYHKKWEFETQHNHSKIQDQLKKFFMHHQTWSSHSTYLKASGKSIAASNPNLRWTPRSVLVRDISLKTLLQADLLSNVEPEFIGGSTGKRAATSLTIMASWDEPGGNPAWWPGELLIKFSSHQHFAYTPLRFEPSFLIPLDTLSCFTVILMKFIIKRTTKSLP